MLIPKHPAGCLLVAKDKTAVAADFFYIIEEGVIKAIHTTEPVQLDGLELRLDIPYGNAARDKIPSHIFVTNPKTQGFTDSKADTNAVLKAKGILVPQQEVLYVPSSDAKSFEDCFVEVHRMRSLDAIPPEDLNKQIELRIKGLLYQIKCDQHLKSSLDQLSIDRFVLKGDGGCRGDYVRMFGRHELEKAEKYATWLMKTERKILLEERILPLSWKDENDQHIDWNIRAFVTLSKDPQWIDAIVRYNILSGMPVNICQGARVEELEKTVARTGASQKRIVDTALKVARVVYNHIKNCGETPTGFLGLDLIVSKKGIYTIEVNSAGSGGFAELLEIRKKPLGSVRYMLECMGPILKQNRAQRTSRQYERTPRPSKRIPNTCKEYLELAETFSQDCETDNAARLMMYEKALTLIKSEVPDRHTDQISALLNIYKKVMPLYITTGQYEKAYANFKVVMRLKREVTDISSETAPSATSEKEKDGVGRLLQLGTTYQRR
jgi:hypothetical protein